MLGLRKNDLKLYRSHKKWEKEYIKIEKLLQKLLSDKIKTIEHIGSTSIPEIYAKPIIDIAIGIEKYEDGFRLIPILDGNGFEYKGEYGIKGRHYFVNKGEIIKYHIHVLPIDSKEYKTHILFRDFLRKNKELAQEYSNLKKYFLKMGYS